VAEKQSCKEKKPLLDPNYQKEKKGSESKSVKIIGKVKVERLQ